jgi:hypothetical protein
VSEDIERQARRARSLLAVARHPNTPPAEAQTAQRLARVLMLRVGLTDADLEPASQRLNHNADPDYARDHRYRPTTPAHSTPGRKWTVYERVAWADQNAWGGLHIRLSINGVEVSSVAEWVRRYGSSTS